MFGPYQIDYQGHSYFGNVQLREFHLFDYAGNHYLVDVQRVSAKPISLSQATIIERVAWNSGDLIPESTMTELHNLKLVADEKTPHVVSEVAGKSEDSPNKPSFGVTTPSS